MTDVEEPLDRNGGWARRALEEDVVGWLTTVTEAGRPQASLVSYLWKAGEIIVYSMPAAPKVRNIRSNPAVSFHLNSDAYGDRWISISGVARIDDQVESWADLPEMAEKYAEPFEHWGLDPEETAETFSTPIRIRPTRIRTSDIET